MALIECKECGHEVSKKADKCPNCGAPIKRQTSGCAMLFAIISGLVLVTYIANLSDSSTSPSSGSSSDSKSAPKISQLSPPPKQTEPRASNEYMVRVAIEDRTKNNPVHPKAEIWFRGHGSWWLKRDLKYGVTAKKLGRRPVGKKQGLIFYPEGREDGPEIKIPYLLTTEMNPKGSHRDTIHIEFFDDKYLANGLPIKAATGDFEIKYSR